MHYLNNNKTIQKIIKMFKNNLTVNENEKKIKKINFNC